MPGLKSKGIKNLSEVSADIVPQSAQGVIPRATLKNVFILNRLTTIMIVFQDIRCLLCGQNLPLGKQGGGIFSAVNHGIYHPLSISPPSSGP